MARATRTSGHARDRRRRNVALLVAGGALVVAAGGYVAYRALRGEPHAYDVQMPESRPTGDPVPIPRTLPAGTRFLTTVETKTRIVLVADFDDLEQGMKIDARLEGRLEVTPREGGLLSTMRWKLVDGTSNIPGRQGALWEVLGDSRRPVVRTRDLDAAGLPAGPWSALGPVEGLALDLLVSGLSDPTESYLPRGRDVRVGEAWKLFEEVGEFAGIDRAVRTVIEAEGEGQPLLTRAGMVKAEALERRGEEETLRLAVVTSLSMEGDTRPPAPPGRVSMGGRGTGKVWVSVASGLPVETEFENRLRSTRTRQGLPPVERNAVQTIRSTTRPAP